VRFERGRGRETKRFPVAEYANRGVCKRKLTK
jgi:hypothetical protein